MTSPIKCELRLGSDVYELDEVEVWRDYVEVADCSDPRCTHSHTIETIRLRAVIGKRVGAEVLSNTRLRS